MKPRIVTVVGNRPQFIKLAPVSKRIRAFAREIIVHSGQHYDHNMSDVFFRELEIPAPDHYLGVTEKLHGEQTAKILTAIERIYISEKPDLTVVFGDTNTTIAAALAAVKLHIPVAHVEAGPRMFDRCESPEEANRIMVDHVSHLLFAPTRSSLRHLKNEGVWGDAYFSGDTMYDTFKLTRRLFESREVEGRLENIRGFERGGYALCTLHRPLNVDDPARFEEIIRGIMDSGEKIIFPIHPRTVRALEACRSAAAFRKCPRVALIEPQGYIEIGALMRNCRKVVTDSGGVPKEAYFNKKPCVTLYPMTPWPETEEAGANRVLRKVTRETVARAVAAGSAGADFSKKFFGDGRSAEKIAAKIAGFIARKG